MAQIGEINRLTITRKWENGVHLDGGKDGDILLPKKHTPKHAQIGDEIEVFVYVNKEGRYQATTDKPEVTVGQFARLKVVANSSIGSYLDWGLQKNLLCPKKEQQVKMEEGQSYVVYVFLDEKTKRIAASSKLDKFLSYEAPNYREGEEVDLFICEKTNLGYKTIVGNFHWGVLYKNEIFENLHIGQKLKGFVKKLREDQKIDIRLQRPGAQGSSDISQNVLAKIQEIGGTTMLTDKSPPEDIYTLFGISKKNFKKAIGALYKRNLVTISPEGISIAKKRQG